MVTVAMRAGLECGAEARQEVARSAGSEEDGRREHLTKQLIKPANVRHGSGER